MYSRPFVVQELPRSAEQPAITIPEEQAPQPRGTPAEQAVPLPELGIEPDPPAAAENPSGTEAAVPLVRSLSEPTLPAAAQQPLDLVGNDSPLQQPSTSNREQVDVIQEWTEEKQDFMVAMFPTLWFAFF